MGTRNKQKALEKLRQLRAEIDGLVNPQESGFRIDEAGDTSANDEAVHKAVEKIEEWQRDSKTAISYLFSSKPNKAEYLNGLRKLNFG